MLKNLDHFNASIPGNFSAYLWDSAGTSTFLGVEKDTKDPSMTVYRVPFTVPKVPVGNYVIQSVYTTNSPVHPTFVQCSDVEVIG